ncbi:HEAT repeat domain-containing protein [Moorena sp. SIO3H5]|uniref:HEAT repeat domain-containing protein n=1 Tax=Moorena sp. SIO3H5 TaxID=2607834 RepID=UPI0013BCF0CB|nr:HEAT repeat domain-containing protein [Moorena sp. SIO3H5]NEO72007.1 NACHT domain-containing protein [Moorena sp. SIO3H5]
MVNWDPYLASIRDSYAQWWQVYTLTDVEGRKPKQQQPTPVLFDFGLMVQTIKSEQPQRDENREQDENREKTERLPVLDGLRKYAEDHVLLVGRPGSGKSTALVRLLGDKGIPGKIPVLVELRYYQTSVLELVRNFIKRHDVLLDSTDIERLLFEGQFWLLIDGVNELPSEDARVDLTQFRKDYQKRTPMIFTTRDLGVGGDLGIEKKFEMQPLSAAQMSEFVRKYLPEKGEQMLEQLGDRLREFGQTPLLLKMLCALFQDHGEIPSNLGLVFRSFTQFYSDNIKQDIKVSRESKLLWPKLLQELGFVMTAGDNPKEITVAIPKTKAEEILTDYLGKKPVVNSNVCPETLVDDLLNHHLLQQSGDLIEFRHQMIQEYYTAEYLLKQLPSISDQELQQNYLNYLKWTEPLVLMLQLVDDQAQAQRVVRLGLEVDWQLGARLAGAVKPEFQDQTIGLVAGLNVPTLLKLKLLGITGSDRAIPELSKCLDHNNFAVRLSVADALEKIGTEATIDLLSKCLDDDDSNVRRRATYALGKIGTEATIAPLSKCLDDDDSLIRRRAAEALIEMRSPATIDVLIKLLKSQDYRGSYQVTYALAEIGDKSATTALIKLLEYQDHNVRINAANALGAIESETAVDGLISCLDDPSVMVRRTAIKALSKIQSPGALDGVLKFLEDEDYDVYSTAADAVIKISSLAPRDGMIRLLNDEDSYVRINAGKALVNSQSPESLESSVVIDPLIKLLKYEKHHVRYIAKPALVEIGSLDVINELIKLLDDEDDDLRIWATEALGEIGSEAASDRLITCLEDNNYLVRRNAAEALGDIGATSAIDGLIKCLEDDYSDVRWMAADALGKLKSAAAIEGLITCLEDEENWVCHKAAESLGNIGETSAIDGLIKVLKNEKFYAYNEAAKALVKIGSKTVTNKLIKLLDDEDFDVRIMAGEVLSEIGIKTPSYGLIKCLEHGDYWVTNKGAEALGKIGTEVTISKLINRLNNKEFVQTNDGMTCYETINALNAIQERYQIYNPTYSPKADRPKPTQTMYILHLSDLHITTGEEATLWSNQLAQDLIQDLQIPNLDALILSGDIANYSTPEEYQAAQQFLDNLRQDFSLDSKQIVLVPGNHDLNWKLAKRGYQLLDLEDYDGELKEGHYIKGEDVIRVRDEAKYQQRFAHFSQFYQAIKTEPYPLDYDKQAIIDYFPEQNLLILGLNSAWELDHHFRDRASIHSGALSKALTEIRRNPDYRNCLKLAVWHHALNSAGSDRITDQGFMEQLAQAGFRFFLHGHIHKAETSLFRYDLSPTGRKLDQIGAGTFGAPTKELIPGYPWQYNLLKVKDNQLTVYTRRREEQNGAWKPDSRWTQGAGEGGLHYYSIEL